MRAGRGALLALILIAIAPPAEAHRLKVFGAVVDGMIVGRVYFAGGDGVAGLDVWAEDPDGAELGRGVTDDDGGFRIPVAGPVDHILRVDSGDGHGATFRVRLTEAPSPSATAAPTAPDPDLSALVRAAVAREVAPLRAQIDTWEAETRWRDVLGGIGYIFGLFGVAFYLLARRRPS